MNFEQMSAAEIKQAITQLSAKQDEFTDEQRTAFINLHILLGQKEAQEQYEAAQKDEGFKFKAKEFDAKAKTLYPELKDENSDFYKAVDARLEEMGTAKTDPAALYNATLQIAKEQDIPASGSQNPGDPTGKIKPSGGSDPHGSGGTKDHVDATPETAGLFKNLLDLNDPKVRAEIQKNKEAGGNL